MTRNELIDRISSVLAADDRVLAAWLTGSLGRGDGDRWSDVYVFAVAKPAGRDGLMASWEDVAARRRLTTGRTTMAASMPSSDRTAKCRASSRLTRPAGDA